MNKKLFASALPFAIILAFFTQISVTNAADINKTVKNFKRMIEENMPGEKFKKHDYLAYDSGDNQKQQTYLGAVGDVNIRVIVNSDGRITFSAIKTSHEIHRNLLGFMEGQFGRRISKDEGAEAAGIKFGARLDRIKLRKFNAARYKYEKNNLRIELEYNAPVFTSSGKSYRAPQTIYFASDGDL